MGYLANEVYSVARQLSYEACILNSSNSQNILSTIREKFCSGSNRYPLWEYIVSSEGIHNKDAWSWISEFLDNCPVIIFFDESDDKSMVRLEHGLHVSKILGECFGFVFYLTDFNYNYLICFNDHDILIGAGTAKDWIKIKSESI